MGTILSRFRAPCHSVITVINRAISLVNVTNPANLAAVVVEEAATMITVDIEVLWSAITVMKKAIFLVTALMAGLNMAVNAVAVVVAMVSEVVHAMDASPVAILVI